MYEQPLLTQARLWRRRIHRERALHVGVRQALARIVAEAEREGMLVLPLNRWGAVVVVPRLDGREGMIGVARHGPDIGIPTEEEIVNRNS